MSVNKVILIGNLGDNINVKTFDNGGKIGNFPLATSETYKKKDTGEKVTDTTWHNIVCKIPTVVDILEKYVSKGDKLYVEGSIKNREYTDKDGVKKYITEIVLQHFDFISSAKKADDTPMTLPKVKPNNAPSAPIEDDDDLPF